MVDKHISASVSLWKMLHDALPKSTTGNALRGRITRTTQGKRPTDKASLVLTDAERSQLDMTLDQVAADLEAVRMRREMGING